MKYGNDNTQIKFIQYIELLELWQKKLNLVSNKSLGNLWERHFADSLQLQKYLTKSNSQVLDLGSGAGFPGMVLAINDKNNNQFNLVDSNGKKTAFLSTVKAKLKLNNVTVIKDRIENLFPQKFDYIVARGLASTEKLFQITLQLLSPNGEALFLKGKNWQEEINDIKNKELLNKFCYKIYDSEINQQGIILQVSLKSPQNG